MVTDLPSNEFSVTNPTQKPFWTKCNMEISKLEIVPLTGNINVMSSPSGFKISRIFCAQADLKCGSIAQKKLFNRTKEAVQSFHWN